MFLKWIFETAQSICLVLTVVFLVLVVFSPLFTALALSEFFAVMVFYPGIGYVIMSFVNWILFTKNDKN